MRDAEFYRYSISKRAAVKTIVAINKELSRCNSAYFYGYQGNVEGQYDDSTYTMVSEIRHLRQEVEEYRKLKAALEPLIKGIR